jgi:hypothetical protein
MSTKKLLPRPGPEKFSVSISSPLFADGSRSLARTPLWLPSEWEFRGRRLSTARENLCRPQTLGRGQHQHPRPARRSLRVFFQSGREASDALWQRACFQHLTWPLTKRGASRVRSPVLRLFKRSSRLLCRRVPYGLQNKLTPSCRASTLENPRTEAAALRPPNCVARAEMLFP